MCFKKLIFVIALTAPLFAFAEQTELERQISMELTKAVVQINSQGPQMLDDETRMDSAATFKNFIIYNNTMVNYTSDQLDVKLFDPLIKETIIDKLCSNKSLKGFIDLGIVMVYRYLGNDGQYITEQSKDMSSCEKS